MSELSQVGRERAHCPTILFSSGRTYELVVKCTGNLNFVLKLDGQLSIGTELKASALQ